MSSFTSTLTQLCGAGLLVAGATAGATVGGAATAGAAVAAPAPALRISAGPSVLGRPTTVVLRVSRLAPASTVAVSDQVPAGVELVAGSARVAFAGAAPVPLPDPVPVPVGAGRSAGTVYAWRALHLPAAATTATVTLAVRYPSRLAAGTTAWTDRATVAPAGGATATTATAGVALVPVAVVADDAAVERVGAGGGEVVDERLTVSVDRAGAAGDTVVTAFVPGWATWLGCDAGSACRAPSVRHTTYPASPARPDVARPTSASPAGGHAFTTLSWSLPALTPAGTTEGFRIFADPMASTRTELLVTTAGRPLGAAPSAPPVVAAAVEAWPAAPSPTPPARTIDPSAHPTPPVTPPSAGTGQRSGATASPPATGTAAHDGVGTTTTTTATTTTTTTTPAATAAGGPARDPFTGSAGPASAATPPAATTTAGRAPGTGEVGAAAASVEPLASTGADAARGLDLALALIVVGGIVAFGARRPAARHAPAHARARTPRHRPARRG